MQYRKLGRTGLKVSVICLGTMNYGSQVDEVESINIIEGALANGVNFFDTADSYVEGRSEEVVGKALKKKRNSVVLATKVANAMGPGVNDRGLSRKHIMQGIEDSLRRLKTDYVDLYYIHTPDYDTPIEETLRAFDDLVHQGKVRYIGCSNFRAWQLCKALWVSDVHNIARIDCIEPPYNLLTRDIEYELLPLCDSEGVGVCVYNPLAAGLLTGKHDLNKPPAKGTRFALQNKTTSKRPMGWVYSQRYWSAANFEAVAQLKQIAGRHGRNLPQFALAWVLSNRTITSAICGASSLQQLEQNMGAAEVELSGEELTACDGVWEHLRPPRFFYGR
jgi:aryl-alcohol dehydrogenase-like predicted oxidoreductase